MYAHTIHVVREETLMAPYSFFDEKKPTISKCQILEVVVSLRISNATRVKLLLTIKMSMIYTGR